MFAFYSLPETASPGSGNDKILRLEPGGVKILGNSGICGIIHGPSAAYAEGSEDAMLADFTVAAKFSSDTGITNAAESDEDA